MKKWSSIISLFFIYFTLQLYPAKSYSQISIDFYKDLPDSIKPKAHNKLVFNDLTNIFKLANNNHELENRFQDETKAMCLKYGPQYKKIKDKKDRLEFIQNIYLYSRVAFENQEIAAKYIPIIKEELGANTIGFEYYLANYYLYNGWYYSHFKTDKINAYQNFEKALEIFKKNRDLKSIKITYTYLTEVFSTLKLHQKSISYNDSIYQLHIKTKNADSKRFENIFYANMAGSYFEYYFDEKKKEHLDSCKKYLKLVPLNGEVGDYKFVQTACLLMRAWLVYKEGNYKHAEQLLDSVYRFGSVEYRTDAVYFTLKSLINLKTGKSQSEYKLISSIKEIDDRCVLPNVFTEAAFFAKKYGNNEEAFYYQDRLLKFNSSKNIVKSQAVIFEREQNNKLNARDLSISKLNEEKSKLYLWGTILFIILILTSILFYIGARSNRRKRNQLFEQINVITETQINQIQLAEARAKDYERKKMGQELHDDLAGSLATLKLELETVAEKTKDEAQQNRLKELTNNANEAYQIARGKSHEWFDVESISKNKGFANIINELLDKGLPKDQFEKEVSIESNAINNFSTETMVELIYITKEAITNIVKYAKANKISLLIYEEIDKIIYEIADNGNGFNTKIEIKGLGIKSMESRVNKLKGIFKIFSYDVGTEIQIILPKNN